MISLNFTFAKQYFSLAASTFLLFGCSAPKVILSPKLATITAYAQQLPQIAQTKGNLLFVQRHPGPLYMRAKSDRQGIWDFNLRYSPNALLQAAGDESIKRRIALDPHCEPLTLNASFIELVHDSGNYPGYRTPSVTVVIFVELRDTDDRVLHRGHYTGSGQGNAFVDVGPFHPKLQKEYSTAAMHALMEMFEPALFDVAHRVKERCAVNVYPFALPSSE